MKKRIWKKGKGYVLAAFLLVNAWLGNCGQTSEAQGAAVENTAAESIAAENIVAENTVGCAAGNLPESAEMPEAASRITADSQADGGTLEDCIEKKDILDEGIPDNEDPDRAASGGDFSAGVLPAADVLNDDTSVNTIPGDDNLNSDASASAASGADSLAGVLPAADVLNDDTLVNAIPGDDNLNNDSSPSTIPEGTALRGEVPDITISDAAPDEIFSSDSPESQENPDYTLSLRTESETLKAGSIATYEIGLLNTGNVPLYNINLTSAFSCPKVEAKWEPTQNLEIDGQKANLSVLPAGAAQTLYLKAQLTQEQDGILEHTVSASTVLSESLNREAVISSPVQPLKIDFQVEKTADCITAMPGDTIHYLICISNTGERTLHSVISTERFVNADIQARFVKSDGVTINEAGNKAMIPSIEPGESFSLQAVVTLPDDMVSQELLNEVTVVTKETGKNTISSQAGITVEVPGLSPSVTAAPVLSPGDSSAAPAEDRSIAARPTSSKPKTSDSSQTELFILIFVCASLSSAGAFWHLKAKSRR